MYVIITACFFHSVFIREPRAPSVSFSAFHWNKNLGRGALGLHAVNDSLDRV